MVRTVMTVALVVTAAVLGLEVVHYRRAVLACNADDKRAWQAVAGYRERDESPALHAARPARPK
jgi:hypothetical protein